MDRRSFGPVLTLAAVLPLAVAAGARSDLSELTGKIAFVRNCSIFVMKADGSGQRRLTRPPRDRCDSGEAWSPEGSRLAFVRSTYTGEEDAPNWIYVMSADGSNIRRITRPGADVNDPRWSPDGRAIAFDADEDASIVNADGTGQRVLRESSYFLRSPSWSPGGDRLAVVGRVGPADKEAIFTVTRRGGVLRRVTAHSGVGSGDYGWPAWQPRGRKILFRDAFCPRHGPCRYEIRVVNSDGSGERRLESVPSSTANPMMVWSPDGARFLISYGRPGIWVMRADGSNSRPLTMTERDGEPSWSSDGRKVAFSTRGGGADSAIYVMNSDGGGPRKLALGYTPKWQPQR